MLVYPRYSLPPNMFAPLNSTENTYVTMRRARPARTATVTATTTTTTTTTARVAVRVAHSSTAMPPPPPPPTTPAAHGATRDPRTAAVAARAGVRVGPPASGETAHPSDETLAPPPQQQQEDEEERVSPRRRAGSRSSSRSDRTPPCQKSPAATQQPQQQQQSKIAAAAAAAEPQTTAAASAGSRGRVPVGREENVAASPSASTYYYSTTISSPATAANNNNENTDTINDACPAAYTTRKSPRKASLGEQVSALRVSSPAVAGVPFTTPPAAAASAVVVAQPPPASTTTTQSPTTAAANAAVLSNEGGSKEGDLAASRTAGVSSEAIDVNMHSLFWFNRFNGITLLIMAMVWNLHAVDAVFAPADRSALQTALFGCVGACGAALDGSGDETYCSSSRNGPWESGTGADCDAASTHGAIDAWDVSRVTSMRDSECSSRILSLSHLSDERLPLALLLLLLLLALLLLFLCISVPYVCVPGGFGMVYCVSPPLFLTLVSAPSSS